MIIQRGGEKGEHKKPNRKHKTVHANEMSTRKETKSRNARNQLFFNIFRESGVPFPRLCARARACCVCVVCARARAIFGYPWSGREMITPPPPPTPAPPIPLKLRCLALSFVGWFCKARTHQVRRAHEITQHPPSSFALSGKDLRSFRSPPLELSFSKHLLTTCSNIAAMLCPVFAEASTATAPMLLA